MKHSFPFNGFFLNKEEAYLVNEHDRNLLLIKSESVKKDDLDKFMLELFDDLCKTPKLFPFLKGVKLFTEYFFNNIDNFTKQEFYYVLSKLQELKIFSLEPQSLEEYTNSNRQSREDSSNKLFSKIEDKLFSKDFKFTDLEIINVIDQFSLANYKKESFWTHIAKIDLEKIVKENEYSKGPEIKLYVQFLYNLSISMPSIFSDSKHSSQLPLIKYLNKVISTFKESLGSEEELKKLRKNNLLSEIPRVVELMNLISLNSNQEIFKYMKKTVDDLVFSLFEARFNKEIEGGATGSKEVGAVLSNEEVFTLVYKYTENYIQWTQFKSNTTKEEAVDKILSSQLFYLLNEIKYSQLNAVSKIYFHYVVSILRNTLLYQVITNNNNISALAAFGKEYKEFFLIIEKYYRELNIKPFTLDAIRLEAYVKGEHSETLFSQIKSEEVQELLTQYKNLNLNLIEKDYREKLYMDISFFENHSKELGLQTINVRNSVLTYS